MHTRLFGMGEYFVINETIHSAQYTGKEDEETYFFVKIVIEMSLPDKVCDSHAVDH